MRKEKDYILVRFQPEVLRRATDELQRQFASSEDEIVWSSLKVRVDGAVWNHDSPDEFFSDYRRSESAFHYWVCVAAADLTVTAVSSDPTGPLVSVSGDSRAKIEAVFEVFESAVPDCRVPEPPPVEQPKPIVFVGHGRSSLWRDLKDHLHEKHGYEVESYEIAARAGHAARDILEDMLVKASVALLIMTGEDQTADGALRARQNVIHEIGLFQGKLGFSRAIVLLEDGTEEFSNINGVEQIRFGKGNIKEAFGEVLAVLRRESQ